MRGGFTRVMAGAAAVVASVAVVGCGAPSGVGDGSGASGEAVSQPPVNVRYSMVWHEGPHLDLMSPLGSFVRAYVEDAVWGFSSRDVDGLSRAVVEASDFDLTEQVTFFVRSGHFLEYQGASDFYVAEVSGPPERTQVTVCRTNPRLGSRDAGSDEGFVSRADGQPPAVHPSLLVVSQEGSAPPAANAGTENVPPREAFGEWRALRFEYSPRREERVEAQRKCNELLGLPAEYSDSPATYTTVPSMPEVAPSPGWPVGSAAAGDF